MDWQVIGLVWLFCRGIRTESAPTSPQKFCDAASVTAADIGFMQVAVARPLSLDIESKFNQ
jgi:hypothetical protein